MKKILIINILILFVGCSENPYFADFENNERQEKSETLEKLKKLKLKKAGYITQLGKHKKVEKNGLKIVYLSGTPLEIGYAHGRLLQEEIKARVEFMLKNFLVSYFLFLNRITYDFDKNISKEYKAELQGISAGAQVSYENILFMSLFSSGGGFQGCSGFSFKDKRDRVVTGRNLDSGNPLYYKNMVLLIIKPQSGYGFASFQIPGTIDGETAFNEKGLTISQNNIVMINYKANFKPITFLTREIIQYSKTISETESMLAKEKIYPARLLLVSGKNSAVVVEMCDEKFGLIRMKDKHLIVTNHSRVIDPDAALSRSGSSGRLEEAGAYIKKRLGNQDIYDALNILRLPGLTYTGELYKKSAINRQSFIFCPATLDFWVASVKYPQGKPASFHRFYGFNLLNELYGTGQKPEHIYLE